MIKNIAEKVINRLTLYHCILVQYENDGLEYISSPQIADLLNIDHSQVRKDISLIGNRGKCKVGYSVTELKQAIEDSLGFKTNKNVFIIGVGNLGSALAKYDNFSNYGLNVLAMFDNDPLRVGMRINNKEVFHISKLSTLKRQLNVEIAILTVPRQYAQDCADYLVEAGIKYVWNFTPRILKVPKNVQVWNENLVGNFLSFTAKNNAVL